MCRASSVEEEYPAQYYRKHCRLYDSGGSLPLNQGRKSGEALYHQPWILQLMKHHASCLNTDVVHVDVDDSRLWRNDL